MAVLFEEASKRPVQPPVPLSGPELAALMIVSFILIKLHNFFYKIFFEILIKMIMKILFKFDLNLFYKKYFTDWN